MDNSLSTWLQLREPADVAARSESLTRTIVGSLAHRETVQVLDLATGTGSNLRYLAPRLQSRQRWRVIDRDSTLLALLPERMSSWGAGRGYDVDTIGGSESVIQSEEDLVCQVESSPLDVNSLDDLDIFANCHLVTASALLDLVSEQWLIALAARCHEVGAAVLFALTYSGCSSCVPAEPEDEMVRDLLNRHQKTDKGLGGPAAGPDAASCAARCFADVGYRVWTEPSDWMLGSPEHELQRRLVDGWAQAATELAPDNASGIARWHARRIAHVDAGRSRIVVGHFDVGATL